MTIGKRHRAFYFAVAGGIAAFAASAWFIPDLAIVLAANVFFLVYLTMSAIRFKTLDAHFLRTHAAREDEPAWVILLVTSGTVSIAVGSMFLLINDKPAPPWEHVALGLASVALGWFTIHTMAAFHYAHLYWRPTFDGQSGDPVGGLDFPGEKDPGIYDFLYFAFVIGMTAQTSDVQITASGMRRINLVHAVVSFFFNTVLVAAAVNVAVSLGD
jgi:uncharacterized membrane protein